MKDFTFDISRIEFEERYDNEEYNTSTLYFSAPKEWLNDEYPEAVSAEISLEYPLGFMPEAHDVTVMMSPTRENEDGYEDYDWYDIDLSYSDIEALLSLAEKH